MLWIGAPQSVASRLARQPASTTDVNDSLLISPHAIVDNQVALSARVAGTYTLSCLYQDLHVQGSPFKVNVRADAACAATSCLMAAPSDTVGGGTSATVRVAARDAFGNDTTSGACVECVQSPALGNGLQLTRWYAPRVKRGGAPISSLATATTLIRMEPFGTPRTVSRVVVIRDNVSMEGPQGER